MGKALLIIVIAAALGGTVLMFQQQGTEYETEKALVGAEATYLAREAARSGYDVGLSEAALNFAARPERTGVTTANVPQGSYDLAVEQTAVGTIAVTATGRASHRDDAGEVETAEHTLWGEFSRITEAPGAVVLDGGEVIPMFLDDGFTISGHDRRPTSTAEGGAPARGASKSSYALLATQPDQATYLWQEFSSQQGSLIEGRSEEGETRAIAENTEFPEFLQNLYGEAMGRVSTGASDVVSFAGNRTFAGAETFGSSPTSPKVVYVDGNASFTGQVRGYGILIVEGDLSINGASPDPANNFAWEGVVYVRKDQEVSFSQTGRTRIEGALVVQSPPPADGGAPVDFVIEEDGEIEVNERFSARVEVLGAAISAGGAYDVPVTLEVKIGGDKYTPWGDEKKAIAGNVNDDQNPRSFDVPNVYEAGKKIEIEARSWLRKGGKNGNSESDWKEHLKVKSGGGNNQLVKVLRDGDRVPNITGFMNQGSVASYVDDFVVDGRVQLEQNQAIYLFELGQTNVNSAAADFQDVVVLVTLADETESTEETAATRSCPSNKVAILHRPPGNPDNAHAICVGQNAAAAHLANHPDEMLTASNIDAVVGAFGTGATSLVNFTVGDDATIQYSSEAIGRLGGQFSTVRAASSVMSVKQRSFDPGIVREVMPQTSGATGLGDESDVDPIITACYDGATQQMKMSVFETLGGVATLGECTMDYDDDDQVQVCHRNKTETFKYKKYLDHIDHTTLGACTGNGGILGGILGGIFGDDDGDDDDD